MHLSEPLIRVVGLIAQKTQSPFDGIEISDTDKDNPLAARTPPTADDLTRILRFLSNQSKMVGHLPWCDQASYILTREFGCGNSIC
jgi:hypothetical protein